MKVIIDEEKIEEILTRGVEKIYPDKSIFKKVLMSGKKIKLYYGIDPTGSSLHLGHLVQLLKLKKFQDLGHEVIILIGDFTAQIGDPTDKQALRKPLTHKQVLENAKGYKKQIGKILDYKKSKIRFVFNEKWTNKLTPGDMLELASHFTVSNLLTRNMFQERIKAGREVHAHEFLYPIFQAYDAVSLDVDLQIGGNDQMFNMLAGRDLMKKKNGKEMFVLTTKLLVDPSGVKMGKTEGNMISLDDSGEDMFGKIMSWPDTLMPLAFEICTDFDFTDVVKDNPRDQKIKLAYEIVKIFHGEKKAKQAQENFINTFSKKGIPDDILEIKVNDDMKLVDALLLGKMINSKAEFRRLIGEGAVTDMEKNEKIRDFESKVLKTVYKIGKHRFIKIK